jgi:hypothetical protein
MWQWLDPITAFDPRRRSHRRDDRRPVVACADDGVEGGVTRPDRLVHQLALPVQDGRVSRAVHE